MREYMDPKTFKVSVFDETVNVSLKVPDFSFPSALKRPNGLTRSFLSALKEQAAACRG